jgi:hypothetical protein
MRPSRQRQSEDRRKVLALIAGGMARRDVAAVMGLTVPQVWRISKYEREVSKSVRRPRHET